MMINFNTFWVLALLVTTITTTGIAQRAKVNNSTSTLIITGTSNIHDWHLKAGDIKGELSYTSESGIIKTINNLQLSVQVESLKSGKSGLDKNAYKALKSDHFKTIDFKLLRVDKITETAANTYLIDAQGMVSVIGNKVQLPLSFTVTQNGSALIFVGKLQINMTHFEVEPPTALLGTIKTAEKSYIL